MLKKARRLFWLCGLFLALCLCCGTALSFYATTWEVDALAGAEDAPPGEPLFATAYRAEVAYAANEAASIGFYTKELVNEQNKPGVWFAVTEVAAGQATEMLEFTLPAMVTDLRLAVVDEAGAPVAGPVTFERLGLRSVWPVYSDNVFFAVLLLAACFVFDRAFLAKPFALGESLQARLWKRWPVFAVLLLGLFASYPLFASYIPFGHDVAFHLPRLEGIYEGLRAGQFPVRVNPFSAGGKGYAVGMMYPDLFLYPFAALRFLGVSLVACYQLLGIAMNVAAAAFMYLAGARILKSRRAAAFCALLYALAPYRLLNLYVRGALGESIAMSFLPLVVLGVYEVFFGEQQRWPVLVAGVSGVVQSHIVSVLMLVLFLALFLVLFLRRLWRDKRRLGALGKAVRLTAGANLWFLLPFAYFYTQDMLANNPASGLYQSGSFVAQFFVNFAAADGWAQLGNALGAMPLSAGLPLLLCGAALAGALLFVPPQKETARLRRVGGVCLGLGALALLLCSTLFPWHGLELLPAVNGIVSNIQFTWRFFGFATLFLALCGGVLAAWFLPAKRSVVLGSFAALFVLCLLLPGHFMDEKLGGQPFYRKNVPYTDHLEDVYHIGRGEYFYNGTDPEYLMQRPNVIEPKEGTLAVRDYVKAGTNLSFAYEADGAKTVTLPLVWYPGYHVVDENGAALPQSQGADKLLQVQLPAQSGQVAVQYTGLWWFRAGDAASLLTLAGCLVWALRKRRGEKAVQKRP